MNLTSLSVPGNPFADRRRNARTLAQCCSKMPLSFSARTPKEMVAGLLRLIAAWVEAGDAKPSRAPERAYRRRILVDTDQDLLHAYWNIALFM